MFYHGSNTLYTLPGRNDKKTQTYKNNAQQITILNINFTVKDYAYREFCTKSNLQLATLQSM